MVTPKPSVKVSIVRAKEIKVGSCHQDEAPQTSVTLALAEHLVLLYSLIK
jgi:hypothetical protein